MLFYCIDVKILPWVFVLDLYWSQCELEAWTTYTGLFSLWKYALIVKLLGTENGTVASGSLGEREKGHCSLKSVVHSESAVELCCAPRAQSWRNSAVWCARNGEGSGTHSSALAWRIPRTEEPGGPQSMRSLRVGHDWATSLSLFTFMHWRRKWQPTPVFLPGESQGRGSLVGCHLWGHTESDTTEAT